jgi:hypothetical protein
MPIRTLLAVAMLACSTAAWAHAPLVEVAVTDRVTGETMPVYSHRGERWIAGTPGNRYAITLHNRSAARVLAVLSVDGVNAISGETAAWDQAGYVLGPGERAEIRGWRKSEQRIAAFEFTALPDSYAARTGRPEHVGVIGVALFREAPPPPPTPSQVAPGVAGARDEAPAPTTEAAGRADSAARAASRIGTGHGRSETSVVRYARFERASPAPDEVITIYYDTYRNLVAQGVIRERPRYAHPAPNPFPGSFVPDPQ